MQKLATEDPDEFRDIINFLDDEEITEIFGGNKKVGAGGISLPREFTCDYTNSKKELWEDREIQINGVKESSGGKITFFGICLAKDKFSSFSPTRMKNLRVSNGKSINDPVAFAKSFL